MHPALLRNKNYQNKSPRRKPKRNGNAKPPPNP
jgi:hypothetical protein